jgi:oligopeptide/dipeptide ABC transporter ATP-binding protein
MSPTLLEIDKLKVHFPKFGGVLGKRQATVYAVDGVSLQLESGKTLGLVGESGCGKTTVGRAVVRLYKPTAGTIRFKGQNLTHLAQARLRALRRHLQMIFQDPFESLNPRHTIGEIISEPLHIHGVGTTGGRREQTRQLLQRVGLGSGSLDRYPHEFSGGQRQRIGIARAIALQPELIVCDEPVSALDVSIQSQIINLLLDLQQELGLAYLFIAHDLAVVRHISDRIAVMYLGKIMEYADAGSLYRKPAHPYTRALLSAIPQPDPAFAKKRQLLTGEVPSPLDPPAGCVFHTRCPHVVERCRNIQPTLRPAPNSDDNNHLQACLRAAEIGAS